MIYTNIINKEKTLKAEAKVSLLDIKQNLVLYRITVLLEDKAYVSHMGICTREEVDTLLLSPQSFNSSLNRYYLYYETIKEAVRNNRSNMFNEDFRISISDVFNGKVDLEKTYYVIATVELGHENMYEYGKEVPYANVMCFDYINGLVDNQHYDLEALKSILLNRKDVTIITSKYDGHSVIKEIPYYNADEEKHHCIEFDWHPCDEDWEKYYKSGYFEKYFDKYKYILKEFFGISMLEER